jgi:hypothetical protein
VFLCGSGAPAAPVKFFLQIGPGLFRTNCEQKGRHVRSGERPLVLVKDRIQPFVDTFRKRSQRGKYSKNNVTT